MRLDVNLEARARQLAGKAQLDATRRHINRARFALLTILCLAASVAAADAPIVATLRVPSGGIQPQIAVDADGTVHMIYIHGSPSEANIAYVRSSDGGQTFSKPLQVNSQISSAIAIGTIRGPHLALGKNGRPHVAWMGSAKAEPTGPGETVPMLYSRLNDDGDAYELQKNVVQQHVGLDGGGSLAADDAGHVFVAWHAPQKAGGGEGERRVWVARSNDDGRTFDAEEPASSPLSGACGCCGMRAFAAGDGKLWLLYRTAAEVVNRDMTLVQVDTGKNSIRIVASDPMKASTCIMSTAAMTGRGKELLAAWETNGQIFWSLTDLVSGKTRRPTAVPGAGGKRKHPALAVNGKGEFLVVWAEGTGWNQGGSVAWQLFDRTGKPLSKTRDRAEGLPVWGLPAAFAKAEGSFVVVY